MLKTIMLMAFAMLMASSLFGQDLSKNDLVGIWSTGGMSTMADRNLTTGAITPSNGNSQKWEFKADGRFAFVGYMQSTMYGCTTGLFNDKQGRFGVDGSRLTLTLAKNFWRNTYSCSPSSNKERNYTLGTETYELRVKTDEYGMRFLCLVNEKGESCFRRESE